MLRDHHRGAVPEGPVHSWGTFAEVSSLRDITGLAREVGTGDVLPWGCIEDALKAGGFSVWTQGRESRGYHSLGSG